MANTFTSLHYHIVFSTKNRERWLQPECEIEVWRYLGGICRAHDILAVQIGGVDDHIHLLLGISPTLALSDVVKRVKGESSKWLSDEIKGMRGFAWQDGYGAFTVGKSQIPDTIRACRSKMSTANSFTSTTLLPRRNTSSVNTLRSFHLHLSVA